MLPMNELKKSLVDVTKECEALWQDNKDLQGHFINELTELQGYQGLLQQIQDPVCNGANIDKLKLEQAKQKIQQLQQKATIIYQNLTQKRGDLLNKLKDGVQQIALMQNDLINSQLLDWKRRQKRGQIGEPFDHREDQLNSVQQQFEFLAEHNWQLRTYASWLLDLLRRAPQIPDSSAQICQNGLNPVVDSLTKLLWMLVSQSFIVSMQSDPVIKTNHKFQAEVRLLIGDRLGIKQQLDNANVTVKIIGEDQARQLHVNQLKEQHIKAGMGTISNDFEKLQLNDHGHMSAKFSNSKLTKIAPRKAAQKGSEKPGSTATDQKYALLFSISSFQLGNVGVFDIWTLSLPIMVTVHGSQDCDAQSNILWQRAFGDVNWEPSTGETFVTWPQLAEVLKCKFQLYTGTQRPLSDRALQYMGEKLCSKEKLAEFCQQPPKITFQMFAKPFAVRELDQLSLAQRIARCPQLYETKYLYPKIDKEEILRKFEGEERNKSPTPNHEDGGYIGSEIVMVAKPPTGRTPSASGFEPVASPLVAPIHQHSMSPAGEQQPTSNVAPMETGANEADGDDFTLLWNFMGQDGMASFLGDNFSSGFPHEGNVNILNEFCQSGVSVAGGDMEMAEPRNDGPSLKMCVKTDL